MKSEPPEPVLFEYKNEQEDVKPQLLKQEMVEPKSEYCSNGVEVLYNSRDAGNPPPLAMNNHELSVQPSLENSQNSPSCSINKTSAAEITSKANSRIQRVMSDEFGRDFCEWFYMMVNRLQPECSTQHGDIFRRDIFCGNSKIEMYLVEGIRSESCQAEGDQACYDTIKQMLTKLKLLFSPNIEGGVQIVKSSHGLVKVFCCGTLHCENSLIGIFEQEFGLVLSPVDRAWKIAYFKVNLKKSTFSQTPSLPPSEVFAIDY